MNFDDKTVLVTGANRGIGRALVEAFLGTGVKKIYAAARNTGSLPDFGDARVEALELDITDTDQVRRAADTASDVDLLINNAGILGFASLLDDGNEYVRRDMEVNYYGTLDVSRRFVPVLEGKPGAAIVNVVTIAAFVNFPAIGGYSASKAALFSATQGMRIEPQPRGIAVHTVNPGPIDTDMAKDLEMDKTSPEDTARNILAGLEADEADIFPDPASQQMFDAWRGNYRDLEQAVFQMHHAA